MLVEDMQPDYCNPSIACLGTRPENVRLMTAQTRTCADKRVERTCGRVNHLREVQKIHCKHKIQDSYLIKAFARLWMELVQAPSLGRVALLLHAAVYLGGSGLRTIHIDEYIDGIVVDVFGISEHTFS